MNTLFRRRAVRGVALVICVGLVGLPFEAKAQSPRPTDERDGLQGPLTREHVVRLALERSPALHAASVRAEASEKAATAEGRLPAPELMAEAWQVPFENPLSFRDAQMLSVGLRQTVPAPGSLGARADARRSEGLAERASGRDRAREVVREVSHGWVDLQESLARLRLHDVHEQLARRVVGAAEARLAAGGRLTDVAQAEAALARVEAEHAVDHAKAAGARARLNVLLLRAPDAPFGAPTDLEAVTVSAETRRWSELAVVSRPDVVAQAAGSAAEASMLRATEKEAAWPTFTVGLSYFAPTTAMPFHGYGLSLGMSLPWLWGPSGPRKDAQQLTSRAAQLEVEALRQRVRAEVAAASASVSAMDARAKVLHERLLPATRRAFDVSIAAYQANQGDLLQLLATEQAVIETELDTIAAHAALEHAVADLEAAVGAPITRTSLPSSPASRTGAP